MTDNILIIFLFIGVLYFIFFTYRKLRIDLFRDKVFEIRRSLFLIAADYPDEFFKENSPYRFFEGILNTALGKTEHFSFLYSLLETFLLNDYSKRHDMKSFDFNIVKKSYLDKIKSTEIRKAFAENIQRFEFHYALFLLTRTFSGLILTSFLSVFLAAYCFIKMILEHKKESRRKTAMAYSVKILTLDKAMNNAQFAYAASVA
jgi:hypothetical protein